MLFGFQKIIGSILVVVGGVKDAGNASQLDAHMVYKALPHRLVANGAIACNSTTTTITDKDYLTILLQI